MTDERLVVLLEARINEFEKRMRQAEQRGTRTYQGLRDNSRSATRQMETDMARAAGSIRNSIASVSGGIGSLGRTLAGGFLGGVAIGGLSEIISSSRQVVEGLAQIGNEAKRAGLSAQAFQEWKYVAETNRISVDALVDGFKELSLRADEFITTGVGPAAEAFTRLGFRAEDLKQRLKDPSALMLEIMKRLEGMDKAAQIRIADEVFGGTGGERFVEMLGQGEDALSDTIAKAHEVGAVLDDELIAKAAELDQKWRDLQTSAGNFFKSAIVGAAELVSELADTREQLADVFPDEATGRALIGDETYEAVEANRDLLNEQSQTIAELQGLYQNLGETAAQTAADLRGTIGTLDAWGYDEAADGLRRTTAEMDELAEAFHQGQISGEDFAVKMTELQAEAASAFDELEAGDRVQFTGVMSQLQRLGGIIANVTALAARMKAVLASAAGTAPEQVSMNAMRQRHAAEQASMDSAEAMAEANDKFTASETARNTATRDQIALEREMGDVRKRAQASGATLTEAEIARFAEEAIAGDEARAAAARGGRGGGGGRSRKGGGGGRRGGDGARARESEFERDAKRIKERIEAYNIEAQVLAAAALSGEDYGDMMAYASEKAKLLAAAQQDGSKITPELEARIDGLARSYAEAGQRAEDAAEQMKKVQEAGERGAEAVAGIFTSALQGADSAKRAVVALIQRIAEVQTQKAFASMAQTKGGGWIGAIGSLLGFASGGYTGDGGRLDPAGIVHRGEYVMNADAVKRIGVRNLDAMQRGGQPSASTTPRNVTINTSFDMSGTSGDEAINAKIRAAGQQMMTQMRREVPGIMQDYQKRVG